MPNAAGLELLPRAARGSVARGAVRLTPESLRLSVAGRAMNALGPDDYLPIVAGHLKGFHWVARCHLHSCIAGTYEPETQGALIEYLKPGMTMFDVGACCGFFTLLSSKLVGPSGRVVAFEPNPVALAYLNRHITLNNLRNVTVLPYAVSDHEGEASFSFHDHISMGKLDDEGDITVRLTSIDTLVQTSTVPPPALMKIDVEGAEIATLTGASGVLAAGPTLLLSTHGSYSDAGCKRMLSELGYHVDELEHGYEIGPLHQWDYLGELIARR